MIRIFRKIKKGLLSENKYVKYSLYAIGEIALVVIGIMIAFQFEEARENVQREQKFELIFEEIKSNLKTDISLIDIEMRDMLMRDSLIELVLHDKLTEKDYRTNSVLPVLIAHFYIVPQRNSGFNNLNIHKEFLPNKYSQLMPLIDSVYILYKAFLDYETGMLGDRANEWGLKIKDSKAWYWKWHTNGLQPEQVQYYLNDDFYKNDVMRYRIRSTYNLLPRMQEYIELCNRLIAELDKIE